MTYRACSKPMQGQQLPKHQHREMEGHKDVAAPANRLAVPTAQDAEAVHVIGGLTG